MDQRTYIQQLFRKYLAGQHTAKELDEILTYFRHEQEDEHLTGLIENALNSDPEIDETLLRSMAANVDRAIEKRIYRQPATTWRGIVLAAAALVAALSVGYYMWRNAQVNQITVTAMAEKVYNVTLPDGSRVWLNAGATLSYPELFKGDKRAVTLTDGQAFFEITRNEEKPFTVQAGVLNVQVLGTAFEVTAYREVAQASVAVQSGKVNVTTPRAARPAATLTANQKATVNTATGAVETSEIDGRDIAGWKENRLVFAADDFETVIEALQRRYGVAIEVQNPALASKKITLRLDDQPLETALEILSISSNLTYEFANDSTVVIK